MSTRLNLENQRAAPQFGPLMTRLMTWAQMRGVERATSREVGAALRLGETQCRELLDWMNRRGMVVQLLRGLYLLPAKLPPGGKWTPAFDPARFGTLPQAYRWIRDMKEDGAFLKPIQAFAIGIISRA